MFGSKLSILATMIGALAWNAPRATAQEQLELPPKAKFHLYVLMGQSNMAGRGVMTDADRRPVPGVLMLDKGKRSAAEMIRLRHLWLVWKKVQRGAGFPTCRLSPLFPADLEICPTSLVADLLRRAIMPQQQ